MRTQKSDLSQLWKRNAVVAVMAVMVCSAVALNWMYTGQEVQDAAGGKLLGEAQLVSGQGTGDEKSGQEQKTGGEESAGPAEDTGAPPDEGMIYTGSDYFASARLNRQQARDSALSLLQDAAAREDADDAVKTQLSDNIQTMADYTVTEAQIENLVVAKGYTDCVAFIGEDALSLAVSAPAGGLTEADTAKILDVVKQTAGYTAGQVTIIEVE